MRDKAFNIAKNAIYDEYQGSLAWMVYNFYDKKNRAIENENISK